MAKIRVLHIITRLIIGGAQENTMYTASCLDKARYQVDVISGPQTGSEGSLIEEFRIRGIQVVILPQLVREINPIKDLISLYRLYQYIHTNHYSIVHTHSSKAGILGRIAAHLAGTPVIVHTVHGWSFHRCMPQYLRTIFICLERITAHFTDACIVVSENDQKQGMKNQIGQKARYHLIRSAIPIDDFSSSRAEPQSLRQELGIPPGIPVLGYIGRFSEQKNPLEWVRVAALVKQELPNCHFLLVGDGPLRQQATFLLRDLGMYSDATLTGLRRDIPQLLSVMDVLLLTSQWEGLPRIIPEAMLMGIPVVSTDVDGMPEIVQNNVTGYLCAPGDSRALASCCIELLTDPEKHIRITAAASKFAHHNFDITMMITQIDQLYTQLISQQGQ